MSPGRRRGASAGTPLANTAAAKLQVPEDRIADTATERDNTGDEARQLRGPEIPALASDVPTLTAALAYADCGFYILPVRRGAKNPGSVLGRAWQEKSSRDVEKIVEWFAGTDHDLALHVGRSGAVAFDVDHPDKIPDALRKAVDSTAPPFQSTRVEEPGRGHYLFSCAPGQEFGNGGGRLGNDWGDVRGRNGVIVVAPSLHKNAAVGGRYAWLQTGPLPQVPAVLAEYLASPLPSVPAASSAEVTEFLRVHTADERPTFLDRIVTAYNKKVTNGASRHTTMPGTLTRALSEARAGAYPAQRAHDELKEAFLTGLQSGPAPRAAQPEEWSRLVAWAVSQANNSDPAEIRSRWKRTRPATQSAGPAADLSDLMACLREYQDIDDAGHILVTLAVAATKELNDEPAWLMLVGPPSGGKTEAIRLLDDVTDYRLNEVTAPGLLCYTKGKNPQPTGVLTRVPPICLLTFGDLSSLLATSDRGGRDQVFGLLRRVYDGEASRDVAPPSASARALTWAGRATIVAAVTNTIDNYSSHSDALGPRWVYYRLPPRDTAAKRAAAQLARRTGLGELRDRARGLTLEVVNAGLARVPAVELPSDMAKEIEDAALVCCWGRAHVPRHGYGRREIDGEATVEEPPRLIRQLRVLARGLLAIGVDENTAAQLVRRVSLNSMPAVRYGVLRALAQLGDDSGTLDVARFAKLERGVATRALEELEVIGKVSSWRQGRDEPAEGLGDHRPRQWKLHGSDGALIRAVLVLDGA